MTTADGLPPYAARLQIDYPEQRNRLTVAFRIILVIPIAIVLSILGGTSATFSDQGGVQQVALSATSGLMFATMLMLLFRQRYPRWWFDFAYALSRFNLRVGAYMALLVDVYPSTEDDQRVHFELDYPNAEEDLNRWLPLIKWLLAIPHYIVLFVLILLAMFATVFAWFAIIIVGRYPRGLYNFVVGVSRWGMRVSAYAFLLVTDRYPPFRLEP